jgi:hypothetical protein
MQCSRGGLVTAFRLSRRATGSTLLLVLTLAALFACTGRRFSDWDNPDVTPADFDRDSRNCSQEAQSTEIGLEAGGGFLGFLIGAAVAVPVVKNIYENCMEDLGYISRANVPPGGSPVTTEASSPGLPRARILRPLSRTAVFAPGAPHEPAGVAFYGALSRVSAKWQQGDDQLRGAIDVVIIGRRGPAATGASDINFQFFIAVAGQPPNNTVLSKRILPAHIALPAGETRAGVSIHFEEVIPLGNTVPSQLRVFLGFQQSPEVIEFFRTFSSPQDLVLTLPPPSEVFVARIQEPTA